MLHSTVPSFYYPSRQTQKQSDVPRVIRFLRNLRCQVEAMTDEERRVNLQKQWIPTVEDIDYLLNPDLRQRDRVEAIMIFHKRDMKGDSPSLPFIGTILGVSKQSVQRFAEELVKRGRARHECQRIVLNEGEYLHPLLQKRIFGDVTVGTPLPVARLRGAGDWE